MTWYRYFHRYTFWVNTVGVPEIPDRMIEKMEAVC